MISCAYCGESLRNFQQYKCHLKILHSKSALGDQIICGQDGCPMDYRSMRSLQNHISHHHPDTVEATGNFAAVPSLFQVDTNAAPFKSTNPPNFEGVVDSAPDGMQLARNLLLEISDKGAISDAAQFVSRLRSNPKIPLSITLEIIESCQDLFSSCMSSVKAQTAALLNENNISTDKSTELLETMSVLENPFVGLETIYKQTKYFERNGFYIAPSLSSLSDSSR